MGSLSAIPFEAVPMRKALQVMVAVTQMWSLSPSIAEKPLFQVRFGDQADVRNRVCSLLRQMWPHTAFFKLLSWRPEHIFVV